MKQVITTIITDLDNTLFDWVEVWYQCFSVMLDSLVGISGVGREKLISEIKEIHERHGTSEYAFLIEELPSLADFRPEQDRAVVYSAAIDAYRDARRKHLKLYPGVADTLRTLKEHGVLIIGYTESMAFYTNYRIRRLGLDGLIDLLYSPEDHDLPNNLNPRQIRRYPEHQYELNVTKHRHTPKGELKPNPKILTDIIAMAGANAEECIYIGDSLMKDVAMAKEAGIVDVYALYGKAQNRPEYDLLRKVTHWTADQVARERAIETSDVRPSYVLEASFGQILALFSFKRFRGPDVEPDTRLSLQLEIWKKVVDVQQHFNDIEMRIRNVAVTIFGAIMGAVGFSIKEHVQISVFNKTMSLGIFFCLWDCSRGERFTSWTGFGTTGYCTEQSNREPA
jgi:FMN phosphatase YigB (HAD superfamily)